jgi:hypothetical protein
MTAMYMCDYVGTLQNLLVCFRWCGDHEAFVVCSKRRDSGMFVSGHLLS